MQVTSLLLACALNMEPDMVRALLSVHEKKFKKSGLSKQQNNQWKIFVDKDFYDTLCSITTVKWSYPQLLHELQYIMEHDTQKYQITHWTEDMIMCRDRKCQCKGCFYENFFTPHDPRFAIYDQSIPKCVLKDVVIEAIRRGVQ